MGRLIYLELKRVVSTRTVWIMLAVILLLSAVMAYFPISYMKTKRVDDQGNVIMLEGKAAIDYQKEKEKVWSSLSPGNANRGICPKN